MAHQGADAAQLGLLEELVVLEAVLLEEGLQSTGAAPEAEGVDGEDGLVGRALVALVLGGLELLLHGCVVHFTK